jgi:hypothetical protein
MTTLHEVALLRLAAQHVAGAGLPGPADAVRRLAAVQAQDLPGALMSVALRTSSRLRKDVVAALDAGELVRSWPMRGTLHLVAAEDLPWLLELLGARMLAGSAARRAGLGLDETTYARARDTTERTLAGGRGLRRRALLDSWEAAGISVEGQRGAHLLGYLAQTGVICLGPFDGAEQTIVLLAEWIPDPRRLNRDESLHELALRFFTGHGPATVADLARWAGSTVRDARAGLAGARSELDVVEVDGTEHFLDPRTPDLLAGCRAEARGVFLLPGFDEFVLGYGDRSAILDPRFADRIVPGGNGMFRPSVVHDGRIVGTWGWTGRGARREVTATPFTGFPDDVTAAIAQLAAALP